MGSKTCVAVLGCQKHQVHRVIDLSSNVRYKGIYVNTAEYPSPIIPQADFETAHDNLVETQGTTEGGSVSDTADRDEALDILWAMLADKLILQVNLLYKGNKVKLKKSGFPTSDEQKPAQLPSAPSIVRVVRLTASSCKIFININRGPLDNKREKFDYTVYVSDDAQGANTKAVLSTKNSRELILTDLTLDKAIWICVSKRNTAGESETSSKLKYMAY